MERLAPNDVLGVIHLRIAELERENEMLRVARDELLVRIGELERQRKSAMTMLGQVRRGRDSWRAKAIARRERIESLQNRLSVMADPGHPMRQKKYNRSAPYWVRAA